LQISWLSQALICLTRFRGEECLEKHELHPARVALALALALAHNPTSQRDLMLALVESKTFRTK
jgi:hypothetical protein